MAALFWIVLSKGIGLIGSQWHPDFDARLSRFYRTLFALGFLLYMLAVSMHYVYLSVQSSRDAEMEAKEAKVLAREAELKA